MYRPCKTFMPDFSILMRVCTKRKYLCKKIDSPLSFYKASITIFPTSSIFKDFKSANGRFIPTNSNTGSSCPSTRTMKLPLPGLSLFISISEVHPCADRYLTIALARVLNTDHLGCIVKIGIIIIVIIIDEYSPCRGNNGRGSKRSSNICHK